MQMSFVINIHLLKTNTNIWLYKQYCTFHVAYFWPDKSLTTDQATLWTKRSNPVAARWFCCDNIGEMKILNLYDTIWVKMCYTHPDTHKEYEIFHKAFLDQGFRLVTRRHSSLWSNTGHVMALLPLQGHNVLCCAVNIMVPISFPLAHGPLYSWNQAGYLAPFQIWYWPWTKQPGAWGNKLCHTQARVLTI